MPRYYFNVRDGEDFIDREGVELDDLEDARTQAILAATEMLREKSSHLWSGSVWTMDVLDAAGTRVAGLSFQATRS